MQLKINSEVKSVFENYPDQVRPQMILLRNLVLETAEEIEGLNELEETLKWGEPSYLAKHGSTLRIDWKKKTPDKYAVYFKCTSKLVPTFKLIHGDLFEYEGNRAILFSLDQKLPEKELKECVSMALRYHKIKHLPFLGA